MVGFNQMPFGRRARAIYPFQYSGFTSNLNTNFCFSLIWGEYQTVFG